MFETSEDPRKHPSSSRARPGPSAARHRSFGWSFWSVGVRL